MELLIDRAESIIKKKKNYQDYYEEEIRRYIENHWDKTSVPLEAFVTFETEEAY